MLVSVIIPSYQPGDYLWECLNSLALQTFSKDEFEIVLVLNGCSEPYKSSINKYIAERMPSMNINFIHTDVGGVSNARNIGLDNAMGEYVTFIDDDDIVSHNYIENLYYVSSPTCVGCSNSYCFENNIEIKKQNFLTKAYIKCRNVRFSLFKYRYFLSPPYAKLIHKNIIGNHHFPTDLKKSEDSIFCMRISPNIYEMKLATEDTIYYQRERIGSAMRTKQSKSIILKEHLYIEWKYFTEWCKHPFKYNIPFVLSRIAACGRNCIEYLKRSKF